MKTISGIFSYILALIAILVSCKNDVPDNPTSVNVYVAGYELSNSNIEVAKYWKNGIALNLTVALNPTFVG
jgi:hypothetical protein